MNDQTPIVVEEAGDHETAYDFGIASYDSRYMEHCLSPRPRVETVFAFVVFCVTVGILSSVAPRIFGYSIEFAWLILAFLGYFAFHLHDSCWCAHLMVDEGIFRAFHALNRPIFPYFEEASRKRYWARAILCLVVTCVLMLAIIIPIIMAFDVFAPIQTLRHIPYSGGG